MVAIARRRGWIRAITLLAAVLAMATGFYGGLLRLGFALPDAPQLGDSHGPLMICGMFGTLIALERAVALGRDWSYLAPIALGLGGLATAARLPAYVPAGLFVLGGFAFLLVSVVIFHLQRAIFTLVLCIGALGLALGNALLASGAPISGFVGFWLIFLVCTIAAERLELSRVRRPPPQALVLFVITVTLFVIGAGLGLFDQPGRLLAGTGLLAMSVWLSRYDVAMRTVRMRGQPRFMASAMLAGYGWLAVTALFLLVTTGTAFEYDVVLHAVFIGFVVSMVFGHALIIFPSITDVRLSYSPWLYAALAMLHASVLVRVAGDILEWADLRRSSGLFTVTALLAFVAILVVTAVRAEGREPVSSF
jgi:hypothetical protein